MRAVFVEKYNQLAVKDVPVPQIKANEALVRMEIANICSQTDTHMLQGIYDCGKKQPFILGHEAAGQIVEVGELLKGRFQVGDRVAYKGMYGVMAEYAAIPENEMVKIPDTVSYEAASMFEVSACAYALIRQTVQMGDKVLLIGQGCAGLLGTIFAKIAGAAQVIAVDINEYKRILAKKYGADVVLDPAQADYEEQLSRLSGGKGFDAVVDFAGIPSTMNSCVQWMRKQGRIGMFGVNCKPFAFDFFQLHDKEGVIYTAGHEYDYNEIPYRKMLDFTLSGQIDLHDFVTHKIKLENVQKGFDMIRDKDETVLRIGLIP